MKNKVMKKMVDKDGDKSLALLVLAAGMGSRYGGLKQLDGVGPGGETILEYAVYDAIQAGFTQVVFVIRKDFEAAFKERVAARFAGAIEVDYVYQSISDIPEGCKVDPSREKPLGTGHAVWAARTVVKNAFAVINADDFYGRKTYELAVDFFRSSPASINGKSCFGLVGFELLKTLSENGTVSRGICSVDTGNKLLEVVEHTRIEKGPAGPLSYGLDQTEVSLSPNAVTSMNFFVLRPSVFAELETQLVAFLQSERAGLKGEFYLPEAIGRMVKTGRAEVFVMRSDEEWLGITYSEDRSRVVEALAQLTQKGIYPNGFWGRK